MKKITIEAKAKINLTLDVLYKRPDGYHEVESIMQTVSLKDWIFLKLIPGPAIELSSNCQELPRDERNLAYKATRLMMENTSWMPAWQFT